MLEISNRSLTKLAASDLGYAVAPRLNAAGRLTDMSVGIQCLLSPDIQEARQLATQLETLNQERRDLEQEMKQQAHQELQHIQLRDKQLPVGLCLFNENWHQGIIGILAGRIKDHCHRPVITFAAVNEHELKGSARSIPGVHIRDVLSTITAKQPNLVSKFGGHAMAAGLSMPREHYEAFQAAFIAELSKQINASDLQGKIYTDGELPPDLFNLELAQNLTNEGPWGQHFPDPLFDGHFTIIEQRIVGNHHLKLTLQPKNDQRLLDAIAFYVDLEHWPNHRAKTIHAAYRLDINEYRGLQTIQLILEYFEAVA